MRMSAVDTFEVTVVLRVEVTDRAALLAAWAEDERTNGASSHKVDAALSEPDMALTLAVQAAVHPPALQLPGVRARTGGGWTARVEATVVCE